jgi:putative transposase
MAGRRPHKRNYNEPGHAHELTFSCYHGYEFLHAERTCEWLRDSLNAARTELDFDLWAFVFMPEHVHLIVHPHKPVYDIADIREAIKEPVGRHGVAFLRKEAPEWLVRIRVVKGTRVRHLFWQPGGGYGRNIDKPSTLLKMIDYIHMNPVRRGLVERAVDWKWSSAAWYEGNGESPILLDPIPPEWLITD